MNEPQMMPPTFATSPGAPPTESGDPNQMPEIVRELTMLRGAVASALKRMSDVANKVKPVVRENEGPEKTSGTSGTPPDSFPVYTDVGRQLRDIWNDVGTIEHIAASVLHRIEL